MPSSRPNAVAMPKPASVVQSVTHELSAIGLRYCHSAPNTSEGAGRIASGTLNALHTTSQITNSAMVNSAGDRTLIASSRLSTADETSQFKHQVLKRLRIGHLQLARARDRHRAAAHDPAAAARQDVDRVGEEHRLAQVVRHQHHRHLARGLQVAQCAPQLLARERVERAERLVEEQDLRFMDQRAADGGALLHAARELPRMFFRKTLQPYGLQ